MRLNIIELFANLPLSYYLMRWIFRCQVYSFPRAVITKYHKLYGLNELKSTVSQIWRHGSQSAPVSLVMSEIHRGGVFLFLLLWWVWFACNFAVSWLATATLGSWPLLSHGVLLSCDWASESLSRRTCHIKLEPMLFLLNLITFVRSLFPNKVTSEILEISLTVMLCYPHLSLFSHGCFYLKQSSAKLRACKLEQFFRYYDFGAGPYFNRLTDHFDQPLTLCSMLALFQYLIRLPCN